MRTELFDFDLPQELIALRPAEPRDSARLLVVGRDDFSDAAIADLPQLLKPGDALVFNDTRVIPAALEGARVRGHASAHIAANLHRRIDESTWRAFVRPARKLSVDERVRFGGYQHLLSDGCTGRDRCRQV